ncbi:MAG: threonine-phosphate decarboxylase [Deltaproteobacteria bacterium]|nr:threonine-phosphate decarboxylase [Deltaproteobacteria bacterium]
MKRSTKNENGHRHGGIRQEDFSRWGVSDRPVTDFSVNLNPLGPPPLIRERWGRLYGEIEPYPTVNGAGVARYYEKRYGIGPETFIAGNGSTELIYLLPRALGLRRVAVVTPSYNDYSRASRIAGASIRPCPLRQEKAGFSPAMDDLVEGMEEGDALWLGNPNNPTGTLFRSELILDLAERFPEKWVIVDEAFMPFVEERENYSLLVPSRPKNVLVLHSLTKFYALAGIRMGGLAAAPDVVRRVQGLKEPWTVNGVAEKIAPLLLECRAYEEESLSLLRKEKARLHRMLGKVPGLSPLSPSVNFLLCQWTFTEDLDDLLGHLLREGIYVRDCRNFPGLERNWFRAAVRLPEENDRLALALGSFSP